jgi:hypothetical protein
MRVANGGMLNICPVEALDLEGEREHFLTCPGCGHAIDLRHLGDVLHRDEPGHRPLMVH